MFGQPSWRDRRRTVSESRCDRFRLLVRSGRLVYAAFSTVVVAGALWASSGQTAAGGARCAVHAFGRADVARALRARQDVWGDELLRAPGGPTYAGARRYLAPLLLARADGGTPLTDSGVYYLAFGRPAGPQGSGSVPLHVADGSQVVSQRWQGRKLTVGVGRGGRERYGSCLARLHTPALAGGWLPILRTAYTDSGGVRYRQESFAAPLPGSGTLASFIRVTVDAGAPAGAGVLVRFSASVPLTAAGDGLQRGGDTYLVAGAGGSFHDSSVSYDVPAGSTRTVYVAWLNNPAPTGPLVLDRDLYAGARASVVAYWKRRLTEGAEIVVPERRVMDAMRNLLVQNLVLTWRYSVGNHYQQLATADGLAAADVTGRYGFGAVNRETLRVALSPARPQAPYRSWKMGAKLAGTGAYYELFRDRAFVEEATPTLHSYLADLGDRIEAGTGGLLRREQYSSDLKDPVYGLHAQAVVWNGLRLMARVWAETGHPDLAARCRTLARRLGAGLRAALRRSAISLPDGSLFVPMRLLDGEHPYGDLTASRSGSYWNLVAPYALSSGILPARSRASNRALAYMLQHGSRLLGLVRAGSYALYGGADSRASGTDQVYGLEMARFLADNDQPDQLVLSLYGQLAAGMTRGTFVSGEAASVTPLRTTPYRAMYLPPNSTSNAAFLETLRLLLVHETSDAAGRPRGLELCYATPRAWLRAGRVIVVRRLRTAFGPVSFTIHATAGSVRVSLDPPPRGRLGTLKLRLRRPGDQRISHVTFRGRPYTGLDEDGETIRLPPRPGHVELVVRFES